jgi:hypothetical protein
MYMFHQKPMRTVAEKLEAIRLAMQYEFPTADIDIMLEEIEKGRAETRTHSRTSQNRPCKD